LSLAQIARQSGLAPAETLMNLLLEQKCTVGMISFSQSIEKRGEGAGASRAHDRLRLDPALRGDGDRPGKPHPRTYGTFPRVLGRIRPRGRKLFPLETAVHKMTGMCAARLRFRDRGLVREGYAADLAIFDPRTVKDESTFADPHRYPTGIPYVVVNGAVVVDGGRMRPPRHGRRVPHTVTARNRP